MAKFGRKKRKELKLEKETDNQIEEINELDLDEEIEDVYEEHFDSSSNENQSKNVMPVTDDVTVIEDSFKQDPEAEKQLIASEVLKLRDSELALEEILENYIMKLVKKQKEHKKNFLKLDVEFNLIDRSITLVDNSVGLSKEDFAALPLEARFTSAQASTLSEDFTYENTHDLTLLELGAFYGSSMEVLSVTQDDTSWAHIDFEAMINTEEIDVVTDKNVDDVDMVTQHIAETGTKVKISNVPYAYDKGWSLFPSPGNIDYIREEIATRFSDLMQTFDLVVRVMYKARVVSDDYQDKKRLRLKRK